MLTYFALTFGTSDVQFRKEEIEKSALRLGSRKSKGHDNITLNPQKGRKYKIHLKPNRGQEGLYLLSSPRKDGETILRYYDELCSIIRFPLAMPLVQSLLIPGHSDYKFLIIYTDQGDAGDHHRGNDSNYLAAIFKRRMLDLYPGLKNEDFIDFPLKQKVTDIDFQYSNFASATQFILQVPNNEVDKIILLAQGGVDQVNQALTLQFIQAFGDKLSLYQQAEDSQPRLLDFTKLFRFDLFRQQIIALIKASDYHGALEVKKMLNDKKLEKFTLLLEFARLRKLFLYKDAVKQVSAIGKQAPFFIKDYLERNHLSGMLVTEFSGKEPVFLVMERFYMAQFCFRHHNLTDFVLSLQIFFETLAGQYLSIVSGVDITRKHFESVMKLIQNLSISDPEILAAVRNRLRKKNEEELSVSFPLLAALALEFSEKFSHNGIRTLLQPLLHVNSQLNGFSGSSGLDKLRNAIAHEGRGVSADELYLASNIRGHKHDKLKYWREMMEELEIFLSVESNPYEIMNEWLIKEITFSV